LKHYQIYFENVAQIMLLEDLQVVLKVAELQSITAAANSLDMQTATASAALKRVEKSLGYQLFIRSTRNLRLSSEGEKYIPQCKKALEILEQARLSVEQDQQELEGEIRIAVSSDLGRNLLLPWVDEMMDEHPNLKLKVNINDSNIDFYRDSVDVALRYGSPEDSSLYGFKICNIQGLLCASPEYLRIHGYPEHPQDLISHNGLFYQLYDRVYDNWTFTKGKETFKIKMKGNRISNDGDLVRRWCVEGKGVAVKSFLDMSNDLLSGKVVSLLPQYNARPTELWLICPSKQLITPAVRLLRDCFRKKTQLIMGQLSEKGILLSKN